MVTLDNFMKLGPVYKERGYLELLNGKHLNSRKNGKILSLYTENTLYCSDVCNLVQKWDNSVQIVRITGHA